MSAAAKRTVNLKVGASKDLPIISDPEWEVGAAAKRVLVWAESTSGRLVPSKARKGFLFYDTTSIMNRASYLICFTDIIDGKLTAISEALTEAAVLLPDVDAPDGSAKKAAGVLGAYAKRTAKALAMLAAWEAKDGGIRSMEWKSVPYAVKEIAGRTVTGIAAVYGNLDDGNDVLHMGSAAKTINEQLTRIRHLWMHNWGAPPTAVINSLQELSRDDLPDDLLDKYPDVTGGLQVQRTYLENDQAEAVFQGLLSGAINEMSIGYDPIVIDFDETENGNRRRNLREIKLYEISDVLWGMNEATVASKALGGLSALATQVEVALSMLHGDLDPAAWADLQRLTKASLSASAAQFVSVGDTAVLEFETTTSGTTNGDWAMASKDDSSGYTITYLPPGATPDDKGEPEDTGDPAGAAEDEDPEQDQDPAGEQDPDADAEQDQAGAAGEEDPEQDQAPAGAEGEADNEVINSETDQGDADETDPADAGGEGSQAENDMFSLTFRQRMAAADLDLLELELALEELV